MNHKKTGIPLISLMLGAMLLAGCAAKPTESASETASS